MGRKIVEAMDPEKAKEVLLGVVNGNDIYEEILGNGAAQETQMPKRRRARRKKNAVVDRSARTSAEPRGSAKAARIEARET